MIAVFTMLCGFVLAGLGVSGWGWFLAASVIMAVFGK